MGNVANRRVTQSAGFSSPGGHQEVGRRNSEPEGRREREREREAEGLQGAKLGGRALGSESSSSFDQQASLMGASVGLKGNLFGDATVSLCEEIPEMAVTKMPWNAICPCATMVLLIYIYLAVDILPTALTDYERLKEQDEEEQEEEEEELPRRVQRREAILLDFLQPCLLYVAAAAVAIAA